MDSFTGIGYEKACRLSNTPHSDIASSLSLPSLPICFASEETRVSTNGDTPEILYHASAIAGLLSRCDVSYLNLKEEEAAGGADGAERSEERTELYYEVVKHDPEAFECSFQGPLQGLQSRHDSENNFFEQSNFSVGQAERDFGDVSNDHPDIDDVHDPVATSAVRKPKSKRKDGGYLSSSTVTDDSDHQDVIGNFCDLVENFCSRVGNTDDPEGEDESSVSLADIKKLKNHITSIRSKKVMHLIPIDPLVRIITILDRQIQRGQIFSVAGNRDSDTDVVKNVSCALECTYAILAIMTHRDMPKQIYKEEIIERILDFWKERITDSLTAFNSLSRTPNKTSENGAYDSDEDGDETYDDSVAKKRRNIRSSNMKKYSTNKVSAAVDYVVQMLCSIQGFLKDLLPVVRLSDSNIMQLLRTSFSTFLVDNIQLLQLKSINLICGVFALYTQHRSLVIDEMLHLLSKLQPSKRALRAYHLPDEEQKQIQMVSALLIQLVQFSANLPESLKTSLTSDTVLDVSVDSSYPIKCHESVTESCCLFWTNVLQRFSTTKAHDASECKMILENLVMDLLTTLNLPEYPASASILEVFCVLLLQNAGLKSKDIPARCMAIDLLGTIAARMKHDAAVCRKDKFWILDVLVDDRDSISTTAKDVCFVCHTGRSVNIVCNVCKRTFHEDCIGVSGQEILLRDWSCHVCLCKRQLTVLQSFCKVQNKDIGKSTRGKVISSDATSPSGLEAVEQILVNYLQESDPQDDSNLFACWFCLCQWFKDDPSSQDKTMYYIARLRSKSILRDSGSSLSLSRNWAKKICLALGQKNSFIRGFDKILFHLLASLRENSSLIRAKALRAVSSIVEADPEVLCDARVQCAVEGRFCDTAISVREAALELVGRHIASHPNVGLKYFLKVAERIKDTGVSVRKRSIKIIRDLCTSNSNFTEATNAFVEIISRVTDEEASVQDLVCKTFYEFWFEEPSGGQTQYVDEGSSSIPVEIAAKTEQIVDVLRKMPNHHLLVTVIKRNLALDFLPQSAKATGINAVSLASVRKRCELICKRLLERILQVNERNNDEEEVLALPYVLALHAFCVVDPMLCTPATDPSQFVVTLQPYLKNKVNSKMIAQLLESIIFVIDAVLPLLRKPQQNVIEELERDLKYMIVRHSFMTVVHACVRCLCSLSKIAGKGASLVECLILLFFRHLQGSNSDNRQMLGRSLFCLGLLLRYGSALITCTEQQLHFLESLSLLKRYVDMDDFSLNVRALQALGYLLIAKPDYMLENDIRKLLEASLASRADSRLKIQALQNMYEYLLDAEIKLVADSASQKETKYPENAGYSVPVAAGAGDTNICGGIVQLYWSSILERCLDVNEDVRQTALKIVEIVLRQGLVHPITCVPCLIALETDPLEANSKLAHHLLMNMNEKHPTFFENKLGDGLQLSFTFVHSVVNGKLSGNTKGKPDGNTLTYVRTGISRMYRLIRGNRNSRNKFMHSVVRKFESGTWNHASVPFLVYCAEILASLPFTSPDEPLYLIYDINRVIQLKAGAVEANMKTWSSLSLKQDKLEIPSEHCKQEEVSTTHPVSDTSNLPSEDIHACSRENYQKSQADCHDAIALQLLLKLKRHLKIVYGLNDARCQAFSLKEHPKPGEAMSRQSIPFDISDITTVLPSSFQEMVQKYQEFKATLKDDTMDYAAYTSTSTAKRKRPSASRSSVRGGKAKPVHARGNSDDDEDDEDWARSSRKLDFSAHKSIGARVTRQSVQQ